MGRLKVFIYFIFLIVATKATAQSIDTVYFSINFPFGYHEAHCHAQYVLGTDTVDFTLNDMSNFSFKWAGDTIPEGLDSLPTATYRLGPGNHNIKLTVIEKAVSATFVYDSTVTVVNPGIVRVPNVFTPNGDGLNDLFKVFFDGKTVLKITIYSRTGTQVFSEESPSIVWDGRNASGSELSEGIYFYVLKVKNNPNLDKSGFLHLYNKKP